MRSSGELYNSNRPDKLHLSHTVITRTALSGLNKMIFRKTAVMLVVNCFSLQLYGGSSNIAHYWNIDICIYEIQLEYLFTWKASKCLFSMFRNINLNSVQRAVASLLSTSWWEKAHVGPPWTFPEMSGAFLRKENVPAVVLRSRCLLRTMCYTIGPAWGGSGDKELPDKAPKGSPIYIERVWGWSWHMLAWVGVSQKSRIDGIVVFRVTCELCESGMMGREGHSKAIFQTKMSPHLCTQPINHHSFHQLFMSWRSPLAFEGGCC